MAAARQKEMKVSMTEEATTSLTRLDWGAEKVLLVVMDGADANQVSGQQRASLP
jgi:hypothetical protein